MTVDNNGLVSETYPELNIIQKLVMNFVHLWTVYHILSKCLTRLQVKYRITFMQNLFHLNSDDDIVLVLTLIYVNACTL